MVLVGLVILRRGSWSSISFPDSTGALLPMSWRLAAEPLPGARAGSGLEGNRDVLALRAGGRSVFAGGSEHYLPGPPVEPFYPCLGRVPLLK